MGRGGSAGGRSSLARTSERAVALPSEGALPLMPDGRCGTAPRSRGVAGHGRPCPSAWVPGLHRLPTPSSAPARPVLSSSAPHMPPRGRAQRMTVTRPSDKPGHERSREAGQRLHVAAPSQDQGTLRGIVRRRWWRTLCRSCSHCGRRTARTREIGSLSVQYRGPLPVARIGGRRLIPGLSARS